MKYQLIIKDEHDEKIFIDEISKEDFKNMMGWDEAEFERRTIKRK